MPYQVPCLLLSTIGKHTVYLKARLFATLSCLVVHAKPKRFSGLQVFKDHLNQILIYLFQLVKQFFLKLLFRTFSGLLFGHPVLLACCLQFLKDRLLWKGYNADSVPIMPEVLNKLVTY